jgi:glutaredoxin-related protein
MFNDSPELAAWIDSFSRVMLTDTGALPVPVSLIACTDRRMCNWSSIQWLAVLINADEGDNMKSFINARAVQTAIDRLSKQIGSIGVPALWVLIKGRDLNVEFETFRRLLKNGHEAELLPVGAIVQDENGAGPHHFVRACAITQIAAKPVDPSAYPQYESTQAEWVVVSGETYQSALPDMENALSDVRLVSANADSCVTVTLIRNQDRIAP